MKPHLEIVPLHDTKLLIKKEYLKFMEINWHIHPEYELVLISSTSGMEYIGSRSKPIDATELLLLGPNIPHMWRTDSDGTAADDDYQIVVQFPQDIFDGILFTAKPFDHIGAMLKRAELGISFRPADIARIGGDLEAMLSMDANLRQEIRLEEIAGIACMTPQALCKYFKQKTRKTLLECINETRIGYACQLLAGSDYNIMQVCYESGYNNLSNFNRYFKKIVGMTPAEYKKKKRHGDTFFSVRNGRA